MGSIFKKAICSSLLLVGLSASCGKCAEFDDLYKKGEKAFASKDYAVAAESYSQALSYSPSDLRARFRYGQSLFLMQDYKASGNQFQTILQCSPGNISARMFYAESLINMGQVELAKPHLQWILKVQPSNERAKNILAQIDQDRFEPEKMPTEIKPIKEVKSNEEITLKAEDKKAVNKIKEEKKSVAIKPVEAKKQVKAVANLENTKEVIASNASSALLNTQAVVKSAVNNQKKEESRSNLKKSRHNKDSRVVVSKTKTNSTKEAKKAIEQVKSKDQTSKQADGFIYIVPRPASILPVDYQYDNEEDKFMNYPAENDSSSIYNMKKIDKIKPNVQAEYAASPAVKLEAHSERAKALEAVSPTVRAQVEAAAAADAYRKKTAEKVDSSVYTTAEAFAKDNRGSYVVCLERSRYFMEKGDLKNAAKFLNDSEQLAYDDQNSAAVLECRIFRGLLYIYDLDYKAFGHHILGLKSSLKPENYQAYLDIYNQGVSAKDKSEKARLAAGVALGAAHFAVAADLLQIAFDNSSSDPSIGRLLSDAQLQSRNFKGAEKTLKKLTEAYPDNAEAFYNLSRFYVTAEFKPVLARKYAEKAAQLSSNDPRCGIVLGLVDFTEGKIDEGLNRIKSLVPSLEDASLKNICERIIIEGENNPKADFASMLAIPGSKRASAESYRMFGEESLKRGMYFSALESYEQIGDKAEIGRTLLAFAAAMKNAGETSFSNKTTDIGLTILSEAIKKDPKNARANLYLALYQYDNGNYDLAKTAIERGLAGNTDYQTRSRLTSVLKVIESATEG